MRLKDSAPPIPHMILENISLMPNEVITQSLLVTNLCLLGNARWLEM
jgi:hypothetical protein